MSDVGTSACFVTSVCVFAHILSGQEASLHLMLEAETENTEDNEASLRPRSMFTKQPCKSERHDTVIIDTALVRATV